MFVKCFAVIGSLIFYSSATSLWGNGTNYFKMTVILTPICELTLLKTWKNYIPTSLYEALTPSLVDKSIVRMLSYFPKRAHLFILLLQN